MSLAVIGTPETTRPSPKLEPTTKENIAHSLKPNAKIDRADKVIGSHQKEEQPVDVERESIFSVIVHPSEGIYVDTLNSKMLRADTILSKSGPKKAQIKSQNLSHERHGIINFFGNDSSYRETTLEHQLNRADKILSATSRSNPNMFPRKSVVKPTEIEDRGSKGSLIDQKIERVSKYLEVRNEGPPPEVRRNSKRLNFSDLVQSKNEPDHIDEKLQRAEEVLAKGVETDKKSHAHQSLRSEVIGNSNNTPAPLSNIPVEHKLARAEKYILDHKSTVNTKTPNIKSKNLKGELMNSSDDGILTAASPRTDHKAERTNRAMNSSNANSAKLPLSRNRTKVLHGMVHKE